MVDEERGILGWIYADVFARAGKPNGAAHYTVRCSRRTDDDDEYTDLKYADGAEIPAVQLSREFDVEKHVQLPHTVAYQLPVVVLLCEFMRPTLARGAVVLEWHEVLTLFHEMGHAIHCE